MRNWVSKDNIKSMGYGRYPFEVHDRRKEATVLEVDEDNVTYALKTDMDDYLGDTIRSIPIKSFISAYEPMQEAFKFICYQNADANKIEYSEQELKQILSEIKKARILG